MTAVVAISRAYLSLERASGSTFCDFLGFFLLLARRNPSARRLAAVALVDSSRRRSRRRFREARRATKKTFASRGCVSRTGQPSRESRPSRPLDFAVRTVRTPRTGSHVQSRRQSNIRHVPKFLASRQSQRLYLLTIAGPSNNRYVRRCAMRRTVRPTRQMRQMWTLRTERDHRAAIFTMLHCA